MSRGARPESTSEVLAGWGMSHHAASRVYRPTDPEGVAAALADAADRGLSVGLRGGGFSYADAALNDRGAVLLLDGLGGSITVDPDAGTVTAPASATIGDLWRAALPHGFWLPVVPGVMGVTLGGAIGANVHGKNHYARGSFREHLRGLAAVDGNGASVRVEDPAALAGWAGSLGLRGVVTSATVALERVGSGEVEVVAESTGSLEQTLERMEVGARSHEYAVAWVDAFGGSRAGRGILHFADPIPPGSPDAGRGFDPGEQDLPSRLFGVVPRGWAAAGLRAFAHDPGMRLLNLGRRLAGGLRNGARYRQTHAAFHFLLDYVPDWKRIYRPHGLLQVQLFLPKESALEGFRAAFDAQSRSGEVAWLGVVKRHPTPRFEHDYWRDGFSLALDFPIRPGRRPALDRLLAELDALRRDLGGGVYAAKDGVWRGSVPPGEHGRFASDLVRRWKG